MPVAFGAVTAANAVTHTAAVTTGHTKVVITGHTVIITDHPVIITDHTVIITGHTAVITGQIAVITGHTAVIIDHIAVITDHTVISDHIAVITGHTAAINDHKAAIITSPTSMTLVTGRTLRNLPNPVTILLAPETGRTVHPAADSALAAKSLATGGIALAPKIICEARPATGSVTPRAETVPEVPAPCYVARLDTTPTSSWRGSRDT